MFIKFPKKKLKVFYSIFCYFFLTPHFLGGEYVAKMISDFEMKNRDYEKEKEKHMKTLREMSRKGLRHPEIGKG